MVRNHSRYAEGYITMDIKVGRGLVFGAMVLISAKNFI